MSLQVKGKKCLHSWAEGTDPAGETLQVLCVQKPSHRMAAFELEQEGAQAGVWWSRKRNQRVKCGRQMCLWERQCVPSNAPSKCTRMGLLRVLAKGLQRKHVAVVTGYEAGDSLDFTCQYHMLSHALTPTCTPKHRGWVEGETLSQGHSQESWAGLGKTSKQSA